MRLKPIAETEVTDEKMFRQFISAAFAQKRKTILNNLKNAPPNLLEKIGDANDLLIKSGIEPLRRAETLEIKEWRKMFENLNDSI